MTEDTAFIMYFGQGEVKGYWYVEMPGVTEDSWHGQAAEVEDWNTPPQGWLNLSFSRRLFNGKPGTVYQVVVTRREDGTVNTVFHGSKKYIGKVVSPAVLSLQARNEAITAMRAVERRRKKEDWNQWREQLKPLKKALARVSRRDRRVLLALIVEELLSETL